MSKVKQLKKDLCLLPPRKFRLLKDISKTQMFRGDIYSLLAEDNGLYKTLKECGHIDTSYAYEVVYSPRGVWGWNKWSIGELYRLEAEGVIEMEHWGDI